MSVVPPIPEPRDPGHPDDGGARERPLSGREEHALADLDARVSAEDPQLSARLARTRPALLDGVSSRALNLSVQALVALVLAVAILPGPWVGALLMIVVIAGSAAASVYATRHRKS